MRGAVWYFDSPNGTWSFCSGMYYSCSGSARRTSALLRTGFPTTSEWARADARQVSQRWICSTPATFTQFPVTEANEQGGDPQVGHRVHPTIATGPPRGHTGCVRQARTSNQLLSTWVKSRILLFGSVVLWIKLRFPNYFFGRFVPFPACTECRVYHSIGFVILCCRKCSWSSFLAQSICWDKSCNQ